MHKTDYQQTKPQETHARPQLNADTSASVSIGAGDWFSWLSMGLLLLD
jgi:hypothetical protein